jgi:hypothetical protein
LLFLPFWIFKVIKWIKSCLQSGESWSYTKESLSIEQMSIVTSNIIQDWNRICLLSLHTLHLQTSIKLSLNAQTSETLLQRKLKLDLHSGCGCIVWLCACVHVCSVAQILSVWCNSMWCKYVLKSVSFDGNLFLPFYLRRYAPNP